MMLDEGEYERWMRAAKRNLESARGDLERGDYNWACFKAQQAAEVAVKALLHGLGLPAFGHSVSRLLKEFEGRGIDVPEGLLRSAKALDKLYVPTRYPNAWAEGAPHEYYTEVDAADAIRHAESVLRWVEETWGSLRRGGG